MMKFTIPTNWQDDFLSAIDRSNVAEVYGKLAADFVGGGKQSLQLPSPSKKRVAEHVKEIHKAGLKFNYLLNATCIDNRELTISGSRRISRLLGWVEEINADIVTVSLPYLLKVIKKYHPRLKVCVSDLAGVNSVERAKYWEELGADKINVLNTDANRDFPFLRGFKKNISCELQLIANVNCLHHCPYYIFHGALASHGSQSSHPLKGFVIDFYRMDCRCRQLADPAQIIRSQWIRPEDVHYYEEMGVDYLKIIDRGMNTHWLSVIVSAYTRRRYDGNLMDLFPSPAKKINFGKRNLWHKFRFFFRPGLVNVFALLRQKELLQQPEIYVDNRQLDNFLPFFLEHDCRAVSCSKCGYCDGVAKKVVRIEAVQKEEAVRNYTRCFDDIVSGRLFKY